MILEKSFIQGYIVSKQTLFEKNLGINIILLY